MSSRAWWDLIFWRRQARKPHRASLNKGPPPACEAVTPISCFFASTWRQSDCGVRRARSPRTVVFGFVLFLGLVYTRSLLVELRNDGLFYQRQPSLTATDTCLRHDVSRTVGVWLVRLHGWWFVFSGILSRSIPSRLRRWCFGGEAVAFLANAGPNNIGQTGRIECRL